MGDMLEFGMFIGILTSAFLVFRFSGVAIKRIERGGPSGKEIDELEQRVQELEEQLDHRDDDTDRRMLELEERLDFAERLLGQQKEQRQLPDSPPES